MIGGKELTIRVPPPRPAKGRAASPTRTGGSSSSFPIRFAATRDFSTRPSSGCASGSEQGMSRDADREGALSHHRATLPRRRDPGTATGDHRSRQDLFDLRQVAQRGSRFGLGLCRAQSLASAGFFGGRRLGERAGRQSALGRLRHMSADLQRRFKELAKGCGVYVGGKFATQNDLSALFTVRAATLYLRGIGRIAFVLTARGADARAVRAPAFGLLPDGRESSGTKPGRWTTASSRCFRCRPARCSGVAARPRSRCRRRSAPIPAPLPMRDAPEEIADQA